MSNHQLRFESVLEQEFAHSILKFLRPEALLKSQVEVNTICGVFRLDFVVSCSPDYRIAFECDGKEFHEESRDEFRDAIIIGEGLVNSIYRLRGSDLTYHIEDLLYIISLWDPEIFNDRSRIILRQLKSREIENSEKRINKSDTIAQVRYLNNLADNNMTHAIWLERQYRNKQDPSIKTWRSELYDFVQKRGSGKLEELYKEYYEALRTRFQ